MEKKPEVDGKWLEVEASDISPKIEALSSCDIGVVKNTRMELAGADMTRFVEKFAEVGISCLDEMEGMDDSQRSFYIFRKMVLS